MCDSLAILPLSWLVDIFPPDSNRKQVELMRTWRRILPAAIAFAVAPLIMVVRAAGEAGRPAMVVARPGPGRRQARRPRHRQRGAPEGGRVRGQGIRAVRAQARRTEGYLPASASDITGDRRDPTRA